VRGVSRLVVALAVVGVALLGGPASADDSVAIRSVDTSDFPLVRLTVSISEGTLLAPVDVDVQENGVPVRVMSVEPLGDSGEGVAAVLAIDVSNSMRGAELETALAAAGRFATGFPASLPVGLLSFAELPIVRSPVTSDRASVQAAVSTLTATTTQGTALYDAVVAGASMFDGTDGGQHNLILLTDGKNTVTTTDLDQAIHAAKAADVNVFTIALSGSDADEETLRALAVRTGGRFTSISTSDLEAVYAGLAQQLSQQFVITYRSKAPFGVPVSVTVTLPEGIATARFLTPGVSSESGVVQSSGVADASEPVATSDYAIVLLAGLVFFAVLNALLLVRSTVDQRRREAALRSRLVGEAFSGDPDQEASAESNPTLIPRGLADIAERAAGSGISAKLARRLHQAGWSFRVGEFLAIVMFAGAIGLAGGFLLMGPVGTLLGLPAVVAPFVVLSVAASKRLGAIQAQLADTLMVIASSLRAGHSFLQSLDTVTKEIAEPGKTEFTRTMSEIRFGRNVDDALDSLAERVGSQDLGWAVTAIKIQRKIGGNLAEILEGVAKTIRERETLRRQVRVLSAEGRISAVVLTVLPIFIALYLTRVNPDYLRVLTSTRTGLILLSVAGGLMLIGYMWMQKIVKLDDV
jgi:tight adherence protein B